MTGAANDVVPGPALTSPTPYPLALGHDRAGNLYMALHDYASDQSLSIYKITRAGVLSIVTNSTQAEAAPVPGPAPASPFDSVTGLAVAPDGTLYIADDDSLVVAKLTPSGTLSIVAGNGTTGTRGTVVPGPATSTQLKVSTVTVTRAWNLYFGEYDAYRLYRLDATRGPSEAPLELTAAAGIARATLSFLPPDDDGNTSVSGYQVSVDGGAWVTLTTTAGSGGRLSGVVTGLTNGQSYSFRVRAVTSISGAAASNAAQATPAAPSSGGGSWFP